MTKKLKTVFFGTPDFSVPSLDLLANHPLVDLKFVISMPDRPAGRGNTLHTPEVVQFAKENSIPFFQTANINNEDEFLNKLAEEKIDLFIVLAFAQFLSKRVLDLPRLGCFNIHTSILPKYRGAAPIQYALLNGDTSTGVSIQKMVLKLDAGDIVSFMPCQIFPDDSYRTLSKRLSFLSPLCLSELLSQIQTNSFILSAQNESDVTMAPSINKQQGLVDFHHEKAFHIYNKHRAFNPWPGLFTYLNQKRLKLNAIELAPNYNLKAGQFLLENDHLIIGTLDGSIRLIQGQLEGKKPSFFKDIFNGFRGELVFNKEPL